MAPVDAQEDRSRLNPNSSSSTSSQRTIKAGHTCVLVEVAQHEQRDFVEDWDGDRAPAADGRAPRSRVSPASAACVLHDVRGKALPQLDAEMAEVVGKPRLPRRHRRGCRSAGWAAACASVRRGRARGAGRAGRVRSSSTAPVSAAARTLRITPSSLHIRGIVYASRRIRIAGPLRRWSASSLLDGLLVELQLRLEATRSSSWAEAGGAGDGGGDAGAGHQPGQGDLAGSDFCARRHRRAPARMRRPRSLRYSFTPPPRGLLPKSASRAVLAGQEAAGQRIVGDDADPLLQAQRLQRGLEARALIEVVVRLQALVARQPLLRADFRASASRGAV